MTLQEIDQLRERNRRFADDYDFRIALRRWDRARENELGAIDTRERDGVGGVDGVDESVAEVDANALDGLLDGRGAFDGEHERTFRGGRNRVGWQHDALHVGDATFVKS